MITLSLKALSLGLSAAFSPGPFQAFLFAEALRSGFRRTVLLIFSPLLSDGPIIVLSFLALSRLPQAFLGGLQVFGGLFLLYLAYENSKMLRSGLAFQSEARAYPGIWKAALINFLNPNPWLYWVTIGVPLLIAAWRQNPAQAVLFLFCFYASMMLALAFLLFLFSGSGRFNLRLQRLLLGVAVFCLLSLALYQISRGIRLLF